MNNPLQKASQILKRVVGGDDPPPPLPQKYVNTLRNIEACTGSLEGKTILEVGADPAGRFLTYLDEQRNLGRAVGINPCMLEEKQFGKVDLRKVDARKIPYGDSEFDLITSTSVFEHVQDLDVALAEIHRVLKPGGYMYAGLGPIWSGVWGHHLWFYYQDKVVDWRSHKLPPYAHLLMSESELTDWCQKKYNDSVLTEKVVEFVYRSDEQNQLFYSDYEKLVEDSPFETVYFVGVPDAPLTEGYECHNSGQLFRDLRARYPGKSGFGYHLIWMLLTKPAEQFA
jgi:ubiquinone/menaquinone biosynthesis C-methylase UbiE